MREPEGFGRPSVGRARLAWPGRRTTRRAVCTAASTRVWRRLCGEEPGRCSRTPPTNTTTTSTRQRRPTSAAMAEEGRRRSSAKVAGSEASVVATSSCWCWCWCWCWCASPALRFGVSGPGFAGECAGVVLGGSSRSRAAGCSARCEQLAPSASTFGRAHLVWRTTGERQLTALLPRTPRVGRRRRLRWLRRSSMGSPRQPAAVTWSTLATTAPTWPARETTDADARSAPGLPQRT